MKALPSAPIRTGSPLCRFLRGAVIVVDRNGVVLASNYRDYTLEVVPASVESIPKMLDSLGQLVYLSASDRKQFKQNLDQTGRYSHVLLRNNLNDTEAFWFAAHSYKFPGVELRARWVREYPQGESAAHVLGYVGRFPKRIWRRLEEQGQPGNYRGTDIIGKTGHRKNLGRGFAWEHRH